MAGAMMVCSGAHLKRTPDDVLNFLKRIEFIIGTVDVRISKISGRASLDSRRWVIDGDFESIALSVADYLANCDSDVDATITAFDF